MDMRRGPSKTRAHHHAHQGLRPSADKKTNRKTARRRGARQAVANLDAQAGKRLQCIFFLIPTPKRVEEKQPQIDTRRGARKTVAIINAQAGLNLNSPKKHDRK